VTVPNHAILSTSDSSRSGTHVIVSMAVDAPAPTCRRTMRPSHQLVERATQND
jgi:hypothetical protein